MDVELFLITDGFDSLRSLILNPAKGSVGAEWERRTLAEHECGRLKSDGEDDRTGTGTTHTAQQLLLLQSASEAWAHFKDVS